MARLRDYRLQVRRLEKVVRAVRQDRSQTDQDGIALRLSEWFAFKQTVQHLHRDYPDIVKYTACFLTHPQDQATRMECKPYPNLL